MPARPTQNACVQLMRRPLPTSSCATQPVPSAMPKNPKIRMTATTRCSSLMGGNLRRLAGVAPAMPRG